MNFKSYLNPKSQLQMTDPNTPSIICTKDVLKKIPCFIEVSFFLFFFFFFKCSLYSKIFIWWKMPPYMENASFIQVKLIYGNMGLQH